MKRALASVVIAVALVAFASATVVRADDPKPEAYPDVAKFVKYGDPVIAIAHVRVIDGTGTPARADQTVVIDRGEIAAVGNAGSVTVPSNAKLVDGTNKTLIPGLVGMHEHLFYIVGDPFAAHAMYYSFPRLYLAGGVTTMRTTGSVEALSDLNLKREIDAGRVPGPDLDVTGPYVSGPGSRPYMLNPRTPQDVTAMVNYYADLGVTSFKAYAFATRASLAALIQAAHKRGLKVAGHLCAVTFGEAIALGIDSLEHGLIVASDFVPTKQPDLCPAIADQHAALAKLDVTSAPVRALIANLVSHHVAITSTLAVIETGSPERFPPQQRMLELLDLQARADYLAARNKILAEHDTTAAARLEQEMQFELAFVKAGGELLAGADPTGYGGIIAGLGDQRELELLVEAGFTPEHAIEIATSNGARFENKLESIGTIATGKNADLVLIDGDPAARIADIEKVEVVFKHGVGFDSPKLIASMKGEVGRR